MVLYRHSQIPIRCRKCNPVTFSHLTIWISGILFECFGFQSGIKWKLTLKYPFELNLTVDAHLARRWCVRLTLHAFALQLRKNSEKVGPYRPARKKNQPLSLLRRAEFFLKDNARWVNPAWKETCQCKCIDVPLVFCFALLASNATSLCENSTQKKLFVVGCFLFIYGDNRSEHDTWNIVPL